MFSTTPKSLKLKSFGLVLAVTVIVLSIASYVILPAKATSRQTQEERTYEIYQPNWPAGVLELVEVKNLQSESFPEDFEMVVKNIGSKPIYGVDFFFFRYRGIGWSLYYGDSRLAGTFELANSKDVPINMGETGVLKMNAIEKKAFRLCIEEATFTVADINADIKKILIAPQIVNFGDGTGYVMNSPYPVKKENK